MDFQFEWESLSFVDDVREKWCKKEEKWMVAVGLGVSFWEPFLCTRAGVFQQKRKQGGKKDEKCKKAKQSSKRQGFSLKVENMLL